MRFRHHGHGGDTILELVRNAQRFCEAEDLPKNVGGSFWSIALPKLFADELRTELEGRCLVSVEGPDVRAIPSGGAPFGLLFIAIVGSMFVCEFDPKKCDHGTEHMGTFEFGSCDNCDHVSVQEFYR